MAAIIYLTKFIAGMGMLLSTKRNSFSILQNEVLYLGKKKVLNEGSISEMVYPGQGEVLGVVTKLLGFDRIMVEKHAGRRS